MGRRGPAPTPTALLKLRGSKIRGNRKKEPKPPQSAPRSPKWMSRGARAEWARITKILAEMGLLSTADRAALVAYCEAFATVQEATKALQQDGMIVTTKNGYKVPHPAVAIRNTAMEHVHKFSQQFGLTPASRPRVQAQEVKGDDKGAGYIRMA